MYASVDHCYNYDRTYSQREQSTDCMCDQACQRLSRPERSGHVHVPLILTVWQKRHKDTVPSVHVRME